MGCGVHSNPKYLPSTAKFGWLDGVRNDRVDPEKFGPDPSKTLSFPESAHDNVNNITATAA